MSPLDKLYKKSLNSYSNFSLFLLIYAVVIILWGAWVRISGSGDGCGPHWPLCKGQIWIDQNFTENAETLIELTHRIKSGLFGILVLLLFLWSRKVFPKNNQARLAATYTLIFTITEALLGANLVLLGLVADNSSILRAVVMSLHLGNTLLLLYMLTACWQIKFTYTLQKFPWPKNKKLTCHICLLLIAISGSWAALASTLFPSESLLSGLEADFASQSHWLLRIRIIHPILALSLAFFSLYLIQITKEAGSNPAFKKLALWPQFFISIGVLMGLTTLVSGSPTTLKILHLLSADLAWISLTVFTLRSKIQA